MSDFRKPPADMTPAEIFAMCAEPLPTVPIDFRFRAAPSLPLSVRAIQGQRMVAAYRRGEPERYMAEALCDGRGAAVVADPWSLRQLSQREFADARHAVDRALARCCPMFDFCDYAAWSQKLEMGLSANGSLVNRMLACFDILAVTGHRVDRPDRFYGLPTGQLLDGHIMVFATLRERQNRGIRGGKR